MTTQIIPVVNESVATEIAIIGNDHSYLAVEMQDTTIFVDMMDIEGNDQFVYAFMSGVERIHCVRERKTLRAYLTE